MPNIISAVKGNKYSNLLKSLLSTAKLSSIENPFLINNKKINSY